MACLTSATLEVLCVSNKGHRYDLGMRLVPSVHEVSIFQWPTYCLLHPPGTCNFVVVDKR